MEEELKPCPFCGPGQSVVSLYFDDVARRWRVGCGRCGCSTGISPRDETPNPAVFHWNKRAAPMFPIELTEELMGILYPDAQHRPQDFKERWQKVVELTHRY